MKTIYFIIACLVTFVLVALAVNSPAFAAGGGHAAPHHASKAANDHDADD